MSWFPIDPTPTDALSPRKRRAVGLGALALVFVAAAGFVYLRSAPSIATRAPTATPSTNPLLISLIPINYDFVSPSLGWAVENTFTNARSAGQFGVFRTVDGAKHWQLQLTGPSSSSGLMPITVQFFDTTHGFMTLSATFTGEQVYRTNDGGATWQAVHLPASQTVVTTFGDTTYGWALAHANSPSGQLFNLYVTTDGGATWQRLPNPPREAFYLAFRGPTEAWMGSLGSSPPHVYTSADTGRTWHRHDLPPPQGRTWGTDGHGGASVQTLPGFGAVATAESGGLTVPGFGANGADADFFTSFDSGSTWMYVPPPPGVVGHQDALHWWAIKGTTLSKSLDAGQTWTRISNALPDWQFVPHVLDANHAWAELTVADGFGLALTIDGGLHWIRADVPQL